jgi:hypothetical protein
MPDTIQGVRQDMYSVTLTVDGIDYGVWDTKSGGEKDSDATSYRPGAMGAQYSLGGWPTLGNITLSRNARLVRDHELALPKLLAAVGTGECVCLQQPLDKQKKPHKSAVKHTGTLKRVTPPPHDSRSQDAAMVEVEIVLHDDITA